MGDQTKAFLYAWCGKSKIAPHYTVDARGPKHNQYFLSECRIDSYDYVAVGKSSRKKDAQTNAAKDFILYLLRRRIMSDDDIPPDILTSLNKSDGFSETQNRPAGYHDRPSKKRKLDEAEDPDANAAIHGNWVLENAKARLHQFFQINNIDAEYKYSEIGPDHNRSFICEMSFFSKKLGRSFSAREHGVNKQMASRACALSLVRQLYHLQVIEACTDDGTKKGGTKLQPQEVTVEESVLQELDAALEALQVQPATIPKDLDAKARFLIRFGSKITPKEESKEENRETEVKEEKPEEKVEKSEETGVEKSEETEGEKSDAIVEQAETKESDDISEAKEEKLSVEASSQEETEKLSTEDAKVLDEEISNDAHCVKKEKDVEIKDSSSIVQEEEEMIVEESTVEENEIIPWSPPRRSRNPWTGTVITEGPFTKTIKQVGTDLKKEYVRQGKTEAVAKMLEERKKLPIWESHNEILEAVENNIGVVVRGAAGCGKTTQLPQFILDSYLESGHGAECSIIVTQPSCISTVAVAERVAAERCEDMGNSIGYITQFESRLPRPYGSILFCTAGVLLKKLGSAFQGVSHVIMDEVQEREINSDFIMMVLRDMVKNFPDIRIILMSGTVNTEKYQEYFYNCPVIEISSTSYSIQEFFLEDCIQYLNFVPTLPSNKKKKEDTEEFESGENLNKIIGDDYTDLTKSSMTKLSEKEISFELIEAILTCIETLSIPGSIIIFLPGWNAISALMKSLQEHAVFSGPSYLILTLHPQLTLEQLHQVYQPAAEGVTKIILSTRIAESSITINDLVYVINTCKEEIKQFTAPNNLTSYVTTWTSKSSLKQRKECASHNRAGLCFHLCSRARFEKLEDSPTPEICRMQLNELALAIRLHHLGYIGSYLGRALTPPPVDAILHAEKMLKEIGALDKSNQVTPLGRILACLPVDPRVGKMIVVSFLFLLGDPLCIIATHSSAFPEPFDTVCPSKLTQVHQYFIGDRWSDHITILNAFVQWQGAHALSKNAEASFCGQYSLAIPVMHAVNDAKNYLKKLFQDVDFPDSCMQEQYYLFNGPDIKLDMVAALLIMGYYPNICYHLDFQKVVTKQDKSAIIHHSSVNCTNQPPSFPSPFFVFGEKVHKTPVTCKRLTMVNPVHLLLFGCNKVELVNNEVRLDGWINLKMDPQVAAKILALRPPLESLLMEVTANPAVLTELRPESQQLIDAVKRLCDRDSVTHRKYRTELPPQYSEPPPKKQPKVNAEPKTAVPKGQPVRQGRGGSGPKPGRDIHKEFGGGEMIGGRGFPRGRGGMRFPPRGGRGRGRGFDRGNAFNPDFQQPIFDNRNVMQGSFGDGFGGGVRNGVANRFPGMRGGGAAFSAGGDAFQNIPRGRPDFAMATDMGERGDIRRGRPGFDIGGGGLDESDNIQGFRRGRLNFGHDDRDEIPRGRQNFGMERDRDRDDSDDILRELYYRRGERSFPEEEREDVFQNVRRGGNRDRIEREELIQRLRREVELSFEREGRSDSLRRLGRDERDTYSLRRAGDIGMGDLREDISDLRFRRDDYGHNYEDNFHRMEGRDDSPFGFMDARRQRDDSPQPFRDERPLGFGMNMQEREETFYRGGNLGRGFNRNTEGRRIDSSERGYLGIRGESREGFRRDIEPETLRGDLQPNSRKGFFGKSPRQGRGGRGQNLSDSDSDDSDRRYWGRGGRRSFR